MQKKKKKIVEVLSPKSVSDSENIMCKSCDKGV